LQYADFHDILQITHNHLRSMVVMASPMIKTPRLSAAVMLLRPSKTDGKIEVFMVQRPTQSRFAPNVFVFPGGAVEPDDGEAEVIPGICVPITPPSQATELGRGVRLAAIRELFEESGILLAEYNQASLKNEQINQFPLYQQKIIEHTLTIAELAAAEDLVYSSDALIHCAHWITPENSPLRFETHFFLALLPPDQIAKHNSHELISSEWIRPSEALKRHATGLFPLVFATVHQLQLLTTYDSPEEALTYWRVKEPQTYIPRVIMQNGKETLILPNEAK
jgi:8-oxo-dGTP pyrophosphatase MutT (NUDIX family)